MKYKLKLSDHDKKTLDGCQLLEYDGKECEIESTFGIGYATIRFDNITVNDPMCLWYSVSVPVRMIIECKQ